jgi:hypothetical protein
MVDDFGLWRMRRLYRGWIGMNICSECGKDMELVGLRHLCVAVPRRPVMAAPVTKPAVSVTKSPTVTKSGFVTKGKVGRPPIEGRRMTVAERQRRHRECARWWPWDRMVGE